MSYEISTAPFQWDPVESRPGAATAARPQAFWSAPFGCPSCHAHSAKVWWLVVKIPKRQFLMTMPGFKSGN